MSDTLTFTLFVFLLFISLSPGPVSAETQYNYTIPPVDVELTPSYEAPPEHVAPPAYSFEIPSVNVTLTPSYEAPPEHVEPPSYSFTIPSVNVSVVLESEIICTKGTDCAGVGGICIGGSCRGLSSVDYGVKCSVDASEYATGSNVWHKAGCTIPIQAKKIQGTGTFDFPNLRKGPRVFRAYFEPDPGNATYAYYYLTPVNPDDEFVNAQLVVIVEGPQRMIRGEVVE